MPLKADLDAIDWKILKQLQDNGRITNVELAERVGISAPPCLRRVRKLEESGVIQGYRAILNGSILGQDIVAFCMIRLHRQSDADLKNFAEKTKNWILVRRAWMVSGESDFLLHCVASDLSTFQNFVIEELTSTPNVDLVRTSLTIRSVKERTADGSLAAKTIIKIQLHAVVWSQYLPAQAAGQCLVLALNHCSTEIEIDLANCDRPR